MCEPQNQLPLLLEVVCLWLTQVTDPSRWCEVLGIYCCLLTPTDHSGRSWTLFWKGAPVVALWGSSLEKFLGTKEGLVCPPYILSKGQGRGTHRDMGAHTAMSLWNTVSAFQVSDHCFSLNIKEVSVTKLVSVPCIRKLWVHSVWVAGSCLSPLLVHCWHRTSPLTVWGASILWGRGWFKWLCSIHSFLSAPTLGWDSTACARMSFMALSMERLDHIFKAVCAHKG